MNLNLLPNEAIKGKTGFYPVCSAKEWEELPCVYKAMEWFPTEVYNSQQFHCRKEISIPEYIIFDVTYLEPYKISATVKVHVQEVQKILMCYFGQETQCHLYSVSGVVFANGVEQGAKWLLDTQTGAFGIYSHGKCIGKQGGFHGFIPSNIEETEDGFAWKGFVDSENRCHYELGNPFRR